MSERERRAVRPVLDCLEGRDLLSGIIAAMAASTPAPPTAFGRLSQQSLAPGVIASGNLGGGNPNGFVNNVNTPLLGNGPVTPQEARRESFRAGFTGRLYTGPGRFADQSTTYYYRGIGGSNFFLHGDYTMAVVTPTDPAKPFIGEAVLNDKSTGTGANVGLILRADRSSVDARGRPLRLAFSADPNVYGGVFFADAAEGTVDISYGPNNTAKAVFNGRIYTNGLTSPLVNSDLYARHARPLKFRPGQSQR